MARPLLRSRILAGAVAAMLSGLFLASNASADPQEATVPRAPDGRPDLSGIWQVMNTAAWDIRDHGASLGVPAGQGVVDGGDLPYQPWAAARQRENYASRATADPEARCYQPGVPRITYMPFPFQIVQTTDFIAVLYEFTHVTRHIYVDGTPHPKGPITSWLMGDSRARWEGSTLVVDVIHFTDQTWLDRAGNFHSEDMHLVERYTPTDRNHIQYEATIEDPKVFTRPWTMRMVLYRRLEPNVQLLDYECYALLEQQKAAGER